jgi:hypothetical protein
MSSFEKILQECTLDLENSTEKCSTDLDSVNDSDVDINCSICLQPAGECHCSTGHTVISLYICIYSCMFHTSPFGTTKKTDSNSFIPLK